ncbi:MAG: hypothetical protein QM572_19425 [Nocardioides sp.]|uniref:hypothetical protein n=1 Tax=Nocardioides sp. TaxID=35761 RepID=UPI0039E5B83D
MLRVLAAVAAVLILTTTTATAGETPAPNPWTGPDGTSSMHGDSAASDTTPYAGPGADARAGRAITLPAVCPTILAGADGLIQALCTEYADQTPSLYLIDPATLLPVAREHLTSGSLLGGVYAYVDHEDRLVTADGTGAILWLGHTRDDLGTWRIETSRTVPVALPDGDAITSVAPGYDGTVWFATGAGRAGFVALDDTVHYATLGAGDETVANSIATSPTGVAVTTDHATYLLRRSGDAVRMVWRQAYDRGSARKPGQLSWGSGSTPTFFGPHTGGDYVVITDNARPQENLLVYRADTGRQVCSLPAFDADNSGTENSPLAFGSSIYLASTYGYPYPSQATADAGTADPESADFVGGFQRFDLHERTTTRTTYVRETRLNHRKRLRLQRALAHARRVHAPRHRIRVLRKRIAHLRSLYGPHTTSTTETTCTSAWKNRISSAAVPRLSRAEGVIYTVERGTSGLTWSLDRISPATGEVLSSTSLGIGPQSDTLQMVGTILPDGTLLQGTITGLVAVRPAS